MPSGLHARELGTIFYSRVAASGQTDGTVWMMAGDGTNDQRVTDGEWPRLSPDKTPVIFLEGGSSPTRGSIVKRVLFRRHGVDAVHQLRLRRQLRLDREQCDDLLGGTLDLIARL